MYNTIKLGSKGEDVKKLCNLLGVKERELFDEDLVNSVKGYQKSKGLGADGIVGFNTWTSLLTERKLKTQKVDDNDYKIYAEMLGIEPEVLKAVVKVETGGKSGFLASGKCSILFEAHYMYNLLRSSGRNDLQSLLNRYPGIISKTWNKRLYKGGEREWSRLELAKTIDEDIANKSASWGMFQIMGANYSKCGCNSIQEFVDLMCRSEYDQFVLGIKYIKNAGLIPYLKSKSWGTFAKNYNGPGYKDNNYDTKLKTAYYQFKNESTKKK